MVVSILKGDGYKNISAAKSVAEALSLAGEIQPEYKLYQQAIVFMSKKKGYSTA